MYQINNEECAYGAFDMRACSEEAVKRFQMGEFQKVKAVMIQQPPLNKDNNDDSSSNGPGNDRNGRSASKRGRRGGAGKKYQGRHRASVVGTASTLKVQPASPASQRSSGRKASKRPGESRTVLRYPGRRDSIY